ncbi:hypothetical protein ABW20_dc0103811 [Dactylellina cionopaga]|nr:hypothetical protein ABW20_dc0103811 [Dactylellina cionopaga]
MTTGWVGYASDIACASCTATTLVGIRPSVATNNGVANTYYTVWTEIYVEAGTTTQANQMGSQWTTSGPSAPYVAPYVKACTSTAYGGGGGGSGAGTQTYTGAGSPRPTNGGGAYPSVDFSNPSVFRGGESIEIQSAGYTSRAGAAPTSPGATPAGEPTSVPTVGGGYTYSRGGGYPSINFDDPNVFRGGPGVGATTPAARPTDTGSARQQDAPPNTTAAPGTSSRPAGNSARPSGVLSSYPPNYSDPNVFRGLTGGISIVSLTGGPPPVQTPATTTYTVRSNFGSNYISVDANASENFRPTSGISIVSLNPPQSFPPPITTSIPVTSRATSAYPSIDFADASVFAGLDPNAALTGGQRGPATARPTGAGTGTTSAPTSTASA